MERLLSSALVFLLVIQCAISMVIPEEKEKREAADGEEVEMVAGDDVAPESDKESANYAHYHHADHHYGHHYGHHHHHGHHGHYLHHHGHHLHGYNHHHPHHHYEGHHHEGHYDLGSHHYGHAHHGGYHDSYHHGVGHSTSDAHFNDHTEEHDHEHNHITHMTAHHHDHTNYYNHLHDHHKHIHDHHHHVHENHDHEHDVHHDHHRHHDHHHEDHEHQTHNFQTHDVDHSESHDHVHHPHHHHGHHHGHHFGKMEMAPEAEDEAEVEAEVEAEDGSRRRRSAPIHTHERGTSKVIVEKPTYEKTKQEFFSQKVYEQHVNVAQGGRGGRGGAAEGDEGVHLTDEDKLAKMVIENDDVKKDDDDDVRLTNDDDDDNAGGGPAAVAEEGPIKMISEKKWVGPYIVEGKSNSLRMPPIVILDLDLGIADRRSGDGGAAGTLLDLADVAPQKFARMRTSPDGSKVRYVDVPFTPSSRGQRQPQRHFHEDHEWRTKNYPTTRTEERHTTSERGSFTHQAYTHPDAKVYNHGSDYEGGMKKILATLQRYSLPGDDGATRNVPHGQTTAYDDKWNHNNNNINDQRSNVWQEPWRSGGNNAQTQTSWSHGNAWNNDDNNNWSRGGASRQNTWNDAASSSTRQVPSGHHSTYQNNWGTASSTGATRQVPSGHNWGSSTATRNSYPSGQSSPNWGSGNNWATSNNNNNWATSGNRAPANWGGSSTRNSPVGQTAYDNNWRNNYNSRNAHTNTQAYQTERNTWNNNNNNNNNNNGGSSAVKTAGTSSWQKPPKQAWNKWGPVAGSFQNIVQKYPNNNDYNNNNNNHNNNDGNHRHVMGTSRVVFDGVHRDKSTKSYFSTDKTEKHVNRFYMNGLGDGNGDEVARHGGGGGGGGGRQSHPHHEDMDGYSELRKSAHSAKANKFMDKLKMKGDDE